MAEKGILFNSGILDGLNSKEARKKIETEIEKRKIGEKVVNYHMNVEFFTSDEARNKINFSFEVLGCGFDF